MTARTIGIATNPASGKDVRRLVARASVFDNHEKCAIVRRAIVGALGAGASRFVYAPDSHHITKSALDEFQDDVEAQAVDAPSTGSALDTTRAASAMRGMDCAVVITLGGDGTNRAFVKGWSDAPLIPISTGTNNVFPRLIEATIAGAAAGLVALGTVRLDECAQRAKIIRVEIDDEEDDLALIDAVLTADRFVGARALLESDVLRFAMLTRAEPAAVGITAIGGLLLPTPVNAPQGVALELGSGDRTVRAPIAPGLYRPIRIKSARRIDLGECIEVRGPGVLAFDGERERVLKRGQSARLTLLANGPMVIDVHKTLQLAACRGAFIDHDGEAHAH